MHAQANNISWTSTINMFPNIVTFFTLQLCQRTHILQQSAPIHCPSASIDPGVSNLPIIHVH